MTCHTNSTISKFLLLDYLGQDINYPCHQYTVTTFSGCCRLYRNVLESLCFIWASNGGDKEQTKLGNTTDIPTQHIKDIINFVKPNNLPTQKFTIRVTNSRKMPTGASGWCYFDGLYDYAKKPEEYHRPHIVIRLAPYTEGYPYKSEPNKPLDKEDVAKGLVKRSIGGGYLDHLILNKEEALIHTIAHEIRHLWQKNLTTKRGKVWGARGKYSDRDADAYAIRKVRERRRIHNPKQVYPHLNWT